MISWHEFFLTQTFVGVNPFSAAGLFVTLGVVVSCICRIDASRPSKVISSAQLIHLYLFFWALEAFVDLFFFQFFSGHDIAFGVLSMLYLYSTRHEYKGKDCVIDLLSRLRHRIHHRGRHA